MEPQGAKKKRKRRPSAKGQGDKGRRKNRVDVADVYASYERVASKPTVNQGATSYLWVFIGFIILMGVILGITVWLMIGIKTEMAAIKNKQNQAVYSSSLELRESQNYQEWVLDDTMDETNQQTSTTQETLVVKRYVVEAGDTLTEIAETHHVSVAEIQYWNQLTDEQGITAGQELKLSEN
ncbi:LysM peptidoglycan-binding domain-containing protein [Vagococcus sp. BWB3-3]|uniref:LysM peptidoglycan-binding domain-containing protein n=1 Tax=Vagococcus allomyrinae TaxID=2794353 RepID=A0A940PH47_9ENTE|nr:LysM domain-containing protein [Vagococcus allomyrinae]MBP1042818.1 LysM peptidoglycan-binding domain-containing protein [Vagococcus allomyrinae]